MLCNFSLFRGLRVPSTMSLFVMVKLHHFFPVALQPMTFLLSQLIAVFWRFQTWQLPLIDSGTINDGVWLISLQLTLVAHFLFGLWLHAVFAHPEHVMNQYSTEFFSSLSHGVFIPVSEQAMGNINSYLHTYPFTYRCQFCLPHKLSRVCTFFSGHNHVKINDFALFDFNVDQWLISTHDFPALLVQQPQHSEQVEVVLLVITTILQCSLHLHFVFFYTKITGMSITAVD